MPVTLGVVGLGLGLGQTIWGSIEKNKAQGALNSNAAARPTYNINPEEYDIQRDAESRANQGMSSASRQIMQQNAEQSAAQGYDAILRGGGNANAISGFAGNQQRAGNQIAIYDDQQRLSNLANLQNAYARMSANKDKAWQINKEEPWKDKQLALSQQLQGANNMFMSGLNSMGSGLTGLAGGLLKSNSMGNPMQQLAGGSAGGNGGSAGGGYIAPMQSFSTGGSGLPFQGMDTSQGYYQNIGSDGTVNYE